MGDLLTTVSIILSVISAVLATVALIFSWVMFRSTSQMQMQAQAILTKISEKVEVVVDRTSHQIDRAWDYLTRPSGATTYQETIQKQDELKEQLTREARQEAKEAIREMGLNEKAKEEALLSRVESLVNRSSERTRALVERQEFVRLIAAIERELRGLASQQWLPLPPPPHYPLQDLVEKLFGSAVGGRFRELIEFRDTLTLTEEPEPLRDEIHKNIELAEELLSNIRTRRYLLSSQSGPIR